VSFGPSNTAKTASNNLSGISDDLLNKQLPMINTNANQLISQGNQNVASGTNFFNTLLHGNAADTTALLQPDINRIKAANQNAITSLSTLMPRGGGRSGTLFNASYQPEAQIMSLFNTTRGQAANPLIAAGLQQTGLGTNLFNTANNTLSNATGANKAQLDYQLEQQRATNSFWSGLGGGLFNLATAPLGGSLLGKGLGI